MSNDAPSRSPADVDPAPIAGAAVNLVQPRSSDIRLARAQIEAARLRHERLAASGQLPRPLLEGVPPIKTLPGYTLVRELHRGGQGVVYLAVQKSTDRQVAIKLLNRELPAHHRAASAGLARFEREIEILSSLKHPNIVTVHDCGRDHGHVYLVMDYVVGRPLDAWANGEAPLAKKLEVFGLICDGVNAAHLRGVIHRDLKPGNILVDERGEPRVLDFGLAKLAEDSVDSLWALAQPMTVTGQFVGSLPWASPEQAEGRTESLDIRTDVYSLGVILYHMLTGQFPYAVTGRMGEVVRQIVETDPVRPSTIERNIDRELETIVLKCLAKEPERRYQSAGDLARDIGRYLAGEAIEARRDSLAYVMTKRLERYRVAAMVTAAIALVVLGALIVSIAYWRQAASQRTLAQRNATQAKISAERADREADQARAVNEFLREILTSVEPEHQGADVRLVEVLASASVTASQRFAGHPQQEAQVRDLIGQVYSKLSLWIEASAQLGCAVELWREHAGPDDPRTLASASALGSVLLALEQTAAAERLLNDLVPRLERAHGPDDPRTLAARRNVAFTHLYRDRMDEAERLLLELRAHPALADDDQMQISVLGGLISVMMRRWAVVEHERLGDLAARAETLAHERVERATRLLGPDSSTTLQAVEQLADLLCKQGQYQAAAQTCRRLLDRPHDRLGACHHVRTAAMHTLACALTRLGQDGEAAQLQLDRLDCLRAQVAAVSPPLFLSGLFDTLRFLDRGGRPAEGEALSRELVEALRGIGGGHDDMAFAAELSVAHFVSLQSRLDEAEPMFAALLAGEPNIDDGRVRGRVHLYYADHLTRRGQFEEAETHLKAAAELVEDIRRGTWDTHPDDIIIAFVTLYEAWNKPDRTLEYQRMRDEMLKPGVGLGAKSPAIESGASSSG